MKKQSSSYSGWIWCCLITMDLMTILAAILFAEWTMIQAGWTYKYEAMPFLSHLTFYICLVPLVLLMFRGVGLYDRHDLFYGTNEYLKVIKARPKTLSPDQVRKIRVLASKDWSVTKITVEVGALNELQVKNVIAGKYYRRIK